MIAPPIQSILRPVLRRVLPPYFLPIDLFNAGQQGVWYDPSDYATLFQDSAGTTPVTAVEQPVGLMLDKSGNGNHAYQSIAASRPTLKQDGNGKYYLSFDGSDDSMLTNNIDFSAGDKMTVWAGLRKLGPEGAFDCFAELSADSGSNNGSFLISAPATAAKYQFRSRGTVTVNAPTTDLLYEAPNTAVLSGIGNISGDSVILRLNGLQAASDGSDQGTGNYGNYPLYIGRRNNATFPFTGWLYGLIVRGAQSTTEQIVETENWLAQKTGIII